MTSSPTGGHHALAKFRRAAHQADRITSGIPDRRRKVELNSVEYAGQLQLANMKSGDLTDLIAEGHVVEVQVIAGQWSIRLRRGDGDITDPHGPTSSAVEQDRIGDLDTAIEGRDFAGILHLLSAHVAAIKIRIINQPAATGTHWIESNRRLNEIVSSRGWLALARTLTTGPAILCVEDLGGSVLTNNRLTVYGPAVALEGELMRDLHDTAIRDRTVTSDVNFRADRADRGKPYPSPILFGLLEPSVADPTGSPTTHPGNTQSAALTATLTTVQRSFNNLAVLLVWGLLASTSTPIDGGIHVTIRGARELALDIKSPLTEAPQPDVRSLLELYTWVALSPEVDRIYFTRQALTLAIVNLDDVPTAAGPALRTAQSLYDLSRQRSVAEVMSSRRSAREIALSAARAAAAQARDASGNAIERVVLQIAAGGGLLVARFQANLPAPLTIGLLLLVAVICTVSACITKYVTLKSAADGLTNELADLAQYRDSISESDLTTIRSSGAVTAARHDLSTAGKTACYTYITAAAAAVIAAVVVGTVAH